METMLWADLQQLTHERTRAYFAVCLTMLIGGQIDRLMKKLWEPDASAQLATPCDILEELSSRYSEVSWRGR
jgi:hypothetical protein